MLVAANVLFERIVYGDSADTGLSSARNKEVRAFGARANGADTRRSAAAVYACYPARSCRPALARYPLLNETARAVGARDGLV